MFFCIVTSYCKMSVTLRAFELHLICNISISYCFYHVFYVKREECRKEGQYSEHILQVQFGRLMLLLLTATSFTCPTRHPLSRILYITTTVNQSSGHLDPLPLLVKAEKEKNPFTLVTSKQVIIWQMNSLRG